MKPTTEADYIYRLIAQGEHQTQDFKFEISDVCKIARTLSAFSNTDGGRLLIGVKDNGKIAGVRSDEEMYMIEAAAKMYCIPPVDCQMQAHRVEGRTVLVVEVQPGINKPVCAKDADGKQWAYVRIKDENILATPVHLKVWRQAGKPVGSLLHYTEREQLLLDVLNDEGEASLNRCSKRTRIPRREVENLLAQLIRYEIVEMVFKEHRFYYSLV